MRAAFPDGSDDERVLLVQWLDYLRGGVIRKADGLDDERARWTPDGHLLSVVGIINHLTRVEWRWIDGGFLGAEVARDESEFRPAALPVADAVAAYEARGAATNAIILEGPLTRRAEQASWAKGADLRFVALHLLNETARHAGHADATRELMDGAVGE